MFVMKTDYVFCEVGSEFLCTSQTNARRPNINNAVTYIMIFRFADIRISK